VAGLEALQTSVPDAGVKHSFQMPENVRLTRLSTLQSQRRRSRAPSIVEAREPPSTLLGGSHQASGRAALDQVKQTQASIMMRKFFVTWKILDVLAPIAKAHGCSPARVSLAWLLAKPVVTSVIIGAKRLDQLQDNLAAVELTLTQDERRQLDEVSAVPPEYPGWLLPFQAADRLGPVDRWERFREAREPH
jgi:hypothetical protein